MKSDHWTRAGEVARMAQDWAGERLAEGASPEPLAIGMMVAAQRVLEGRSLCPACAMWAADNAASVYAAIARAFLTDEEMATLDLKIAARLGEGAPANHGEPR